VLDPRDLFPDTFILEELCGTILLILVLAIAFAYFRKRNKWNGYVKRFGDRLEGDDRTAFIKRMKGSIGGTMLAAIVFLVVLFFGLLVSIAFVNNIIGEYVWLLLLVFIIIILVMQTYMILSLGKLKDLPTEEYGYLHDLVKDVSEKFDEKPPTLKMDESPDMNAYTTSIFGRSSVIVITKGLLDRVEAGKFTKDQLQSIIGHEMGHIVNNDATITTLFNPAMMFVLAVKGFLEIIVRGLLFAIISSGRFGMKGVLRFILAIIVIILMVWILLYVGIYYVIFYLIAIAIVVAGSLVSRQKEYAADLFGSLVMGSRLPLGTGLMALTRETGFELVKRDLAIKEIEERTKKEEEDGVPEEERMKPEDKMMVLEGIDAYEAVEKDPELLKEIPMRDARTLIEKKGLEPFTEDDFVEFAAFEYTTQEKVGELMLSHPLMGKRAAGLNQIKLVTEQGRANDDRS